MSKYRVGDIVHRLDDLESYSTAYIAVIIDGVALKGRILKKYKVRGFSFFDEDGGDSYVYLPINIPEILKIDYVNTFINKYIEEIKEI